MTRDGEVKQRQHFIIMETQFAIQDQVMYQPNCTERLHVDATIMRSFQTEQFSRFLQLLYASHFAGGCQSSEMAALLNSYLVAFTNSFLPKYRVKYYDYIIKWCSGI